MYIILLQGLRCLTTYDSSTGPYLVGLTGGIASGKSSILNRMVRLGAFSIDCDKVEQEVFGLDIRVVIRSIPYLCVGS